MNTNGIFGTGVVVALDGFDHKRMGQLVTVLSPLVDWFKIHDAIDCYGMPIIRELKGGWGIKIWADVKLLDIPATVKLRIEALQDADMVSVHLSGGDSMVSEAMSAASKYSMGIAGITKLSSSNYMPSEDLVGVANRCLVDAVVGDPSMYIDQSTPLPSMIKIVAGIRPVWFEPNTDHVHPRSPSQAIRDGADVLVVGRPITQATDPAKALARILEEVEQAKGAMK